MTSKLNYQELAEKIKSWGQELGFADVGICDVDLSAYQSDFLKWLENSYHGNMDYMARHGSMRTRPDELHPGAIRVISVRMDYLPTNASFALTLKNSELGYVSRYALGRDYHKLMRNRLKQLGEKIKQHCQQLNYRPFVDSAPILERPLAEKAGLGWVGKHSLIINKNAGSWFFLGELLVDIPLPINDLLQSEVKNECGECVSCIKICPTQAIVAPYTVDARRCISYLTIELQGSIPEEFRALIGNRIYGCDDCQLICPWNRFANLSTEDDFQPRHKMDNSELLTLFSWSEDVFLRNTQGSPIRRIGHNHWLRNIAVALGNANFSLRIVESLNAMLPKVNDMVAEHIHWAIAQQQKNQHRKNERLTARLIRTVEKGLPRDA